MSTPFARAPIQDAWAGGPPGTGDLDQLVFLSNLIGRETRLVQPGGGNTSIKVRSAAASGAPDVLLVKGSGTDLATIGRAGFTPLALARLNTLREAVAMDDADMMRFMASCMLPEGGPAPSVETPLHSLLPQRVIVHTHDIATMSLTNVRDAVAERLVAEVFAGEIVYVPFVRPGFPLAKAVAAMVGRIPPTAVGLALAHHGLVVWGDEPRACYGTLVRMIARMEECLETARRGKHVFGTARRPVPDRDARVRCAETLLPVVRGALGGADRVILHYDDADDLLTALAADKTRTLVGRGVATPEHILRAGRLPAWLELDPSAPAERLASDARAQLAAQRVEYEEYHRRNAGPEVPPLDDWAKVVLAPGVGMITAFKDKASAVTANRCYRAVLESIANAEAVDEFQFLPETDVFAFEHWPLERRKVDEQIARERATLLLPRHVAVVIGGGSGIGKAAAHRFAAQGAHVVAADLDADAAAAVAADVAGRFPGRAVGVGVDVRDDASLQALFREAVLAFGGVDCLFYTAGLAPRFASLTDLTRDDLQRQLDVHYLGAVGAMAAAARVMRRQQRGGSIVVSVSKAALAPGRDALAYGASKAAMLQAVRVAAVELGAHGIRVNAINADQIDTPMFRRFVEERAAARGLSVDQQLEAYRDRNVMGVSLIPAEAVADLAVLLASDRFRYTTGDVLTVDGGLPEAFPR
ncbi:MAG TPA: SDR family oxidoreductase [Gemmatimonadales bacterium]